MQDFGFYVKNINKTSAKRKKKVAKKLTGWDYATGDRRLNPTSGVCYFNGRKETYYSSEVLYHYNTANWILDDEGCYRTKDGYYVVASTDYKKGTIIDISKGKAKVLDCGCHSGVVDVYVNWRQKMNRKETTEYLSRLLEDRLAGKYYAKEVVVDYGWGEKQKRIDYMEFIPKDQMTVSGIEKGIFVCYEIKSCKADVFSGNGVNFLGEKNYIVTTRECYEKILPDLDKLKKHIKKCSPDSSGNFGIMVADELWTKLEVVKSCRESYRKKNMSEMLFLMLRAKNREVRKLKCGI